MPLIILGSLMLIVAGKHECLGSPSIGLVRMPLQFMSILAEGAIALSVTLSGGALFAS